MVCNFLKNKSARCMDQDDPYHYLREFIDTIISTNTDDIYKNIRNDNNKDLTILMDNDDYLFFICHNYEACKKYGSRFWCIVEDEGTFEEYTKNDVQSIFFFKDKTPFVDEKSVLGITIDIRTYKISASHWEDDDECVITNSSNKKAFYDTIFSVINENKSILNKIYSISLENQIENDPSKFEYFIKRSDDKTIFDFIKRKTFKKIVTDYEFEQLTSSESEKIFNILFKNNYDISEVFDREWVYFILSDLNINFFIKNVTKLVNKKCLIDNLSSLINEYCDSSDSGRFIFLCSMFDIELMPYYKDYLEDDDGDFNIDPYFIDNLPGDKFILNYKLIINYYSSNITELSDEKLKLILNKEPEIFFKNLELFKIFLEDSNLYNEYKDKIVDKISKMNKSEINIMSSVIMHNDLDELYPYIINSLLPKKIADKYDITYTKK